MLVLVIGAMAVVARRLCSGEKQISEPFLGILWLRFWLMAKARATRPT